MVVRKPNLADISAETQTSCSRGSCWHITLVILVILSLVMNAISLYFLSGNSYTVSNNTVGIKKALLDLEYEKVGGQANYDLIQKMQMMNLKEQLPQIEQYIKSGGASADTLVNQPTNTAKNLDAEAVKTILADAVIEGNKDASVIVIEYSEMECPFCSQQYHDTKLHENLKAKYGDKVAFVYKGNRGANHKGTEVKALGLLCAKKVGNDTAYAGFYKYVMDRTTYRPAQKDGTVFPVDQLPEVAKAVGLDVKVWQDCVDKKDTLADFTRQTAEAQKFGLSGTPGTLILNVKTGKYETANGAVPFSDFIPKIDSLLQ